MVSTIKALLHIGNGRWRLDLGSVILRHILKQLVKALFDEHYPAEVIKLFNDRMREIRIAATADRVIIGFINRMIWEIQFSAREMPDSRNLQNEFVLGAHYRRGIYMALPHYPVKLMRDILLNCDELNGIGVPEPLSRGEIREQLGIVEQF